MKKVFITTLGCKVNQFESAAFTTSFIDDGYEIVQSDENADVIVINTCAVTSKAGAQSRNLIRKSFRNSPQARIVITGCYAETEADEIGDLPELSGREFEIIGNSDKDLVVPKATDAGLTIPEFSKGGVLAAKTITNLPVKHVKGRTRAHMRIQDGCENFCSYCIVPYTRGPSRSLSYADVVDQCDIYLQEGFKEIVLTGIHLGHYGKDLDEGNDITSVVDKLTRKYPEMRFRISSLEPTEITDDLLRLIKERSNLMPHLHIPLQSGNDEILEQMNRHYTTAEFRTIIDRCHEVVPGIAIGIDILAGFPGESDDHFQSALDFASSLDFCYLHVFPYSRRKGTPAADFAMQVPKAVKTERVAQLRQLSADKKKTFYLKHLGTSARVLVEGKRDKSGLLRGFSENYIEIRFQGEDALKNHIVHLQLEKFTNDYIYGTLPDHHEN